MHHRSTLFVLAVILGVFAASLPPAFGQGGVVLPMIFGNTVPIIDEYGENLKGSSAAGSGDLVQIYRISSGSIRPPNEDGTPRSGNVPLAGGTAYIGFMVSSSLIDSGLFATSLPDNQPPVGTRLFVRVFNAPTMAEASFYGDSQEITIASGRDSYVVNIPAANIPLDWDDPDEDSLHNSWEKSLGTDPNHPDTDRDGMTDYEEWLAGTDPLDPNSLLRIEDFVPISETEMGVVWQSASGRCYYIEFADDILPGPSAFEPLHAAPFEAVEGPTSTMPVDVEQFGIFRVRLVPCE